jgi:hypothetical protein
MGNFLSKSDDADGTNPVDPNAKPVDPNAKPVDPNAKPVDPTGDVPVQSGGKPRVTIDIFGSEKKNSKGFLINDIKITPQNLNSTFSSKDQVEHFLTNVFDYVKNSNLPKDEQEPIRNFFHSYKETINIKPASVEEPASDEKSTSEDSKTAGGGKKKRSRNRKPKARHRKTKKH